VGLVHRDVHTGAALIEFPHEAETGVNRIWVPAAALQEAPEVPA
jgi:hypothetical protein